jgi:ribosomal protein S18 acetylase RimI-like enzyme
MGGSLSFLLRGLFGAPIRKETQAGEPKRGKEESAAVPSFKVRPAIRSDYEQICELYEELDSFHRKARPDLFNRPSAPPRERSTINAYIKGDATEILVAEAPGAKKLLGFALLIIRDLPASSVCLARRFVEVDKFAVRPEARRLGVGRAIMEAAFAWAEERGFDCAEVAVHEFNAGAIAFYNSMGFETVLRRMMRLKRR